MYGVGSVEEASHGGGGRSDPHDLCVHGALGAPGTDRGGPRSAGTVAPDLEVQRGGRAACGYVG